MAPRQKIVLISLLAAAAFGMLVLGLLWSMQVKAERTVEDWASREGYRILRKTWAVNPWDRGRFCWTTASHYPVIDAVIEDASGVRRECWVGCDVWTPGRLGRVEVVWKANNASGGQGDSMDRSQGTRKLS